MAGTPSSSIRGGFPLGLPGATAATRYVGATASGAPATGTFAVGDFTIDQSCKVYVCTAAGAPGTWAQVGPSSGTLLPVAAPAGVTVDTTTYDNTVTGSGKLTTLVFPTGSDTAMLAVALLGDAFPRWLFTNDPVDGLYLGNGTADPYAGTAQLRVATGRIHVTALTAGSLVLNTASVPTEAVQLGQLSPKGTINTGALPTKQYISGAQSVVTSDRDVELHTPVTFNPGVATTATCQIELSPDGGTYSELATVTYPVGTVFAGLIQDIVVRVPAGWNLRFTVVNATLGLSTYY